jgi:hypothetical protein
MGAAAPMASCDISETDEFPSFSADLVLLGLEKKLGWVEINLSNICQHPYGRPHKSLA